MTAIAACALCLASASATRAATLLVSYPMNEASWGGTAPQVADASGNGHDGTVAGPANTVSDPLFGQVGGFYGTGAGTGDTSGGYVSVGGPSASVSGARSIVAWVNPSANSSYWGQPIVSGGYATAGDMFGITGAGGENSGLPQYELFVDHWGYAAYNSTATVTPGQWNFVAMTFDGAGNVQFYINGAFAGGVSGPGLYDYDLTTYTVGGNTIGGSTMNGSLNGQLRDVGIYSGALSPSDISALYTATSVPEPGTLAAGLGALALVAVFGLRRPARC